MTTEADQNREQRREDVDREAARFVRNTVAGLMLVQGQVLLCGIDLAPIFVEHGDSWTLVRYLGGFAVTLTGVDRYEVAIRHGKHGHGKTLADALAAAGIVVDADGGVS
jgi:hypothetical protein